MKKKTFQIFCLTTFVLFSGVSDSNAVAIAHNYECDPVYDQYNFYLYDKCAWYTYQENGQRVAQEDIAEFNGDVKKLRISKLSEMYGKKFSLPEEKAKKLAKGALELEILEGKRQAEILNWAQRFYGVSTAQITQALSSAQAGDTSALDELIGKIAASFGATPETMKEIVKELHGFALREKHIEL